MKLAILPGLRWKGKITVERPEGKGWLVQWDAEIKRTDMTERFVYDRAVLSADTIKAWTGVDVCAKASE